MDTRAIANKLVHAKDRLSTAAMELAGIDARRLSDARLRYRGRVRITWENEGQERAQ